MGASAARAAGARRVHRRRRADRHHRRDRPLGDHPGLPRRDDLRARRRRRPALRMSVNLSPRQLGDPGLVGHVEAALAESGLPPTRSRSRSPRPCCSSRTRCTTSGSRAPVARHQDRARRLRHRLLVARLPARADAGRPEARPVVRGRPGQRRARDHDRRGRDAAGARARAAGHRRGRRDAGAGREPAVARLRVRPGLPVLPPGDARRRERAAGQMTSAKRRSPRANTAAPSASSTTATASEATRGAPGPAHRAARRAAGRARRRPG